MIVIIFAVVLGLATTAVFVGRILQRAPAPARKEPTRPPVSNQITSTQIQATASKRIYSNEKLGFRIDVESPFQADAVTLENQDQYSPYCRALGVCISYKPGPADRNNVLTTGILSAGVVPDSQLIKAPQDCDSLAPYQAVRARATRVINGIHFSTGEVDTAAAGTGVSGYIRRTWQDGRCYEVTVNIATMDVRVEGEPTFTREELQRVVERLELMANTFQFLP
jgi:hypothetical protein